MDCSLLDYAAVFGASIGTFSLALMIRPSRMVELTEGEQSNTESIKKKEPGCQANKSSAWWPWFWPRFVFAVLMTVASALFALFALNLVAGYGESGDNQDVNVIITVVLGLLGVVMTIITAGVYSISDRAIRDLDKKQIESRKLLDDRLLYVKTEAEKSLENVVTISNEVLTVWRDVGLVQKRLEILHTFREAEDDVDEEQLLQDKYLFQTQRYHMYLRDRPEDLVNYISHRYTIGAHYDLFEKEIQYLKLLRDFWSTTKSAKDEPPTIAEERQQLIKKISSLLDYLNNRRRNE